MSLLGVHIIGSGVGESIIIQLPDGQVGVIDCYTHTVNTSTAEERVAANETLRFLVNELKVDSLAFLGVTHPHEDHARGIRQLLEHFLPRIGQIWMHAGSELGYLRQFFRAKYKTGIKLDIEKLFAEPPGTFYVELLRLRKLVEKYVKQNGIFVSFRGFGCTELCAGAVEVCFLGPSDTRAQQYEMSLANNLTGVVAENGKVLNDNWNHGAVNHNEISAGCLIKFGKTAIVVGGDMEKAAWQDAMSHKSVSLQAQLVKISHHGSETGHVEGLFEKHAIGKRRPIGVVAPYLTHQIPDEEGVKYLAGRTARLISSNCLVFARRRTATPEVSSRLVQLIIRNPKWAGCLDPSLVAGDVEPSLSVPTDLLRVLRREPHLTVALRDSLKCQLPPVYKLDTENDCRVSFCFDDHGNELARHRHVGRCAGDLKP